jgi:type IV secretion system protein TrbC
MMPMRGRVRARIIVSLAIAGLFAATGPVRAAGSNMPWEQPLQQILQSIEGPVTKVIAVIVIITTGLSLAFGDAGGGFRRLIQIVFGLSIAFGASSFFLSFFSFGGGALIWQKSPARDPSRASRRWPKTCRRREAESSSAV